MNDINILLDNYDPGKPEHKPDVTKQLKEIGFATFGYPEFVGVPTEGDDMK